MRRSPGMRTAWVMALAGCVGFLASSPARADDAGTRSVFSDGAGLRSLALGGAYVALANDASAVIWNPGGLGLAPRREIQASHADYGLGSREEYAAVVLPSWRFGAVGFAYRSFGSDGIERRDDRNVLLESDLVDNESEVTVGVGRTFAAWNAGLSVNLETQSIAGFKGSGVGMGGGLSVAPLVALGSRVPWGDRLTVGLAARNLVEPSIRLATESVPDPATWRTGAAYRTRWVITALDLEHSRGVTPRLHVGAEFNPHPLISLRAGWGAGSAVAGLGVRWRRATLDYAFEDAALSPIHRVGISLALGSSMAEQRAASLRAEEDRIQARLAEAFDRAQQERVDTLLAHAEEARGGGRYDLAMEILAAASTLAPSEPRVQGLQRRCLSEQATSLERSGDLNSAVLAYGRLLAVDPADSTAKAALVRCRAESDRRAARSSALQERFAVAMDAFAAEDFAAARNGFASVLSMRPNDNDAGAMMRRTEQAIERRTGTLLLDARRSIDAGRLVEAAGFLDQVRSLDPKAAGLTQTSLMLTQARQLAQVHVSEPKVQETPKARPALSAAQRRELDDLYRRGLQAMEQNRPDDALRYWEIVWSADPGYARIGEYLEREYLLRGLNAFSNGRLEDAVSLWEKALQVDPGDEKAKGYIARAEKQLARTRELLGDTSGH